MANKNVLVIGGEGFIGSNLIAFFLKNNANYTVINLDKLTYAGNKENLTELENNNKHKFIKGEICNAALVRDIIENNRLERRREFFLLDEK